MSYPSPCYRSAIDSASCGLTERQITVNGFPSESSTDDVTVCDPPDESLTSRATSNELPIESRILIPLVTNPVAACVNAANV